MKREEFAQALDMVRRKVCYYDGVGQHDPDAKQPSKCDCKFGIRTRTFRGGEESGCPEMRVAVRIIETMSDRSFKVALKQAGWESLLDHDIEPEPWDTEENDELVDRDYDLVDIFGDSKWELIQLADEESPAIEKKRKKHGVVVVDETGDNAMWVQKGIVASVPMFDVSVRGSSHDDALDRLMDLVRSRRDFLVETIKESGVKIVKRFLFVRGLSVEGSKGKTKRRSRWLASVRVAMGLKCKTPQVPSGKQWVLFENDIDEDED